MWILLLMYIYSAIMCYLPKASIGLLYDLDVQEEIYFP